MVGALHVLLRRFTKPSFTGFRSRNEELFLPAKRFRLYWTGTSTGANSVPPVLTPATPTAHSKAALRLAKASLSVEGTEHSCTATRIHYMCRSITKIMQHNQSAIKTVLCTIIIAWLSLSTVFELSQTKQKMTAFLKLLLYLQPIFIYIWHILPINPGLSQIAMNQNQ